MNSLESQTISTVVGVGEGAVASRTEVSREGVGGSKISAEFVKFSEVSNCCEPVVSGSLSGATLVLPLPVFLTVFGEFAAVTSEIRSGKTAKFCELSVECCGLLVLRSRLAVSLALIPVELFFLEAFWGTARLAVDSERRIFVIISQVLCVRLCAALAAITAGIEELTIPQGYAKLVKVLFAEIVGDLEAQIVCDRDSDLHRHNKVGGTL